MPAAQSALTRSAARAREPIRRIELGGSWGLARAVLLPGREVEGACSRLG